MQTSPRAAWAAGPTLGRLWDEPVDHERQVQPLTHALLHWATTRIHACECGLHGIDRSSRGNKEQSVHTMSVRQAYTYSCAAALARYVHTRQ